MPRVLTISEWIIGICRAPSSVASAKGPQQLQRRRQCGAAFSVSDGLQPERAPKNSPC